MINGIKLEIEDYKYTLEIFTNGGISRLYYDRKEKKDLLTEIDHQVTELWKRRMIISSVKSE